MRVLTTLTRPDAGSAKIAGIDVLADPIGARAQFGLATQDATVDGLLTGRENLVMIGELNHLSRRAARARADALLEEFSLEEAARRPAKEYSGGMRRRLDLAATLVAEPRVLFLDEPTTGLDPRARNELWETLDTLVGSGATLLLTTQYLEEAERLADDIVVIDHGRVIARGDSRETKRQVGGEQLQVSCASGVDLERVADLVERVAGVQAARDPVQCVVTAPTEDGSQAVAELMAALVAEGILVEGLGLRRPTLDDAFLALTGHPAEPDDAEAPSPALTDVR